MPHGGEVSRYDGDDAWRNRKRTPIRYLVKFGSHAIAERLYYRVARMLDLPQQHVFWGIHSQYPELVAVAIQFEAEAFFPKIIDAVAGTVLYRRREIHIPNAIDHVRHRVLHTFCGSSDGNQAMVKDGILFGIDAADCTPRSHNVDYWRWILNWFESNSPDELPTVLTMMKTIATRSDIPALIEDELRNSPPSLVDEAISYSLAIKETHNALYTVLDEVNK